MSNSNPELLQAFLAKATRVHGDRFDYSKVNYLSCKKKIEIICGVHGPFFQTPDSHLHSGCPKCSYSRTGLSQRLTTEKFVELARKVHGDKFDYSKTEYVTQKIKIRITCRIHGDFWQKSNNHLQGKGCLKCRSGLIASHFKMGKDEFVRLSRENHGDKFDYSKVEYVNCDQNVKIICPKHGEFEQAPFHHIRAIHGCRKCFSGNSSYEQEFVAFFKRHNLTFEQGDRSVLDGKELDFIVGNAAIEIDGIYWHSELAGKDYKYHLWKTNLAKSKGIKLIHVFESEIIEKKRIVFARLKNLFGLNRYRIWARKCVIKEVDAATKDAFLEKHHIQGHDYGSKINLGLFYGRHLVSVMTFSSPRKCLGGKPSEGHYELARFCSRSGFTVVGAASKLLKHFEKNYHPKHIISYADKRWSEGELYFKLGFKHSHDSAPNYWYFQDAIKLYHRFGFRKNILHKKLENFNPELSEWENMKANGWNRIWDCGNMVFKKIYE